MRPGQDELTLVSLRDRDTWVSADIVYAWEDALAANCVNARVMTLGAARHLADRLATTRRLGRLHASDSLAGAMRRRLPLVRSGSMMLTCVNVAQARFLHFLRPRGLLILHLVDCWERDVEAVTAHASVVDLLLLASQDSADLVRRRVPSRLAARVHVFPVFVDEARYPALPSSKTVDIVQVGRTHKDLHKWASRYADETGASYLYQRRCRRGIYYDPDGAWEARDHQLSYRSLLKLISSARIALVSPPDSTDAQRCGAVSPLTPRYLEAAMCYAVPVGIAPCSAEYASDFPDGFTQAVDSYGSFAKACERMLTRTADSDELLLRNRAYVMEQHSASTRARQLDGLLEWALTRDMAAGA